MESPFACKCGSNHCGQTGNVSIRLSPFAANERSGGQNTIRQPTGCGLGDTIPINGEKGAKAWCRRMDEIEDRNIPYSKAF